MPESITSQIAALHKLSVSQLRQKMQSLTGEPCRQTHRRYLIKRLAYKIQERHYGGISAEAKEQITELQTEFKNSAPDTWFSPPSKRAQQPTTGRKRVGRDPRLPAAGTVLRRDYQGAEYTVDVEEDGFIFEGQPFKSLSGVAQAICGCHISGFTFFRLNQGSSL